MTVKFINKLLVMNRSVNIMYEDLIKKAAQARENAYAEYSGFKVGAALLCDDGTVFTGCNIENRSYSVTNCAERTALFKAVSEGKRNFTAVAVVGSPEGTDCLRDLCFPCGACLQALSEFCGRDFKVVLAREGRPEVYEFCQLMPNVFSSEF